ncbi:hypothetical protein [Nocardia arthritidis]|uniref:hypothetical protein n=1 Tax=Nocardia arthritidis TaxID=228602 RepID=UPI0007A3A80E|nr:hypothetical protein [Nocardia arthritidis]
MESKPFDPNNKGKQQPWPWEAADRILADDHPIVARHLADSTVRKITTTLRELVDMAEVHEQMAPETAGRVWELATIVSGELVAWVRRWRP